MATGCTKQDSSANDIFQQANCNNCNNEDVNGYCKDCNKFLCHECIVIHKSWGPFANHNLSFLTDDTSQLVVPVKQDETMKCSKHSDLLLKFFCETCQNLICYDCTIRDHKEHNYIPVKDSYDEHCKELEERLSLVNTMLGNIANVLTALANKEIEIKHQRELIKQEIHVIVKEMIDVLQQSERQLTKEVETVIDGKLEVLSSQKKSAEMSLSQLNDCKEFVERNFKTGSYQQVLLSKEKMIECMSHVIKKINIEEYNPLEKADVRLIKNNKLELHHIGDIKYTTVLQQCKVKINQIIFENKIVLLPLSVELPNSSLLIVPLSSLSCSVVSTDNIPINTTVTTTGHPGVYNIHCSPVIRGPHKVNVKVNNFQLDDIPLVIPFGPYLDNITSICTINGLHKPCGVAVNNDGQLIVIEWDSSSIILMNKEGRERKQLHKLSSPRGITITPENFILVTSKHEVNKIAENSLVAKVGREGNEQSEFNCPDGITISPITKQIYVADRSNNRIQVFNFDLTFAYMFGDEGSTEGQFSSPRSIAVDNQGLVYVSDSNNHRIQIFTSEGKFKSQFGMYGSGPGKLKYPTGIAVNNNLLYTVEEGNHRVSIFTADGQFISCFGAHGHNKDLFDKPRGISFDNEGYLYICDFGNNRVVKY